MPKVTKIPPRLNPATFAPLESVEKRKVAGYARVSTDSEEQKTSYTAQVDYYTKFIKERIDWEFVGVYTDEGINATNTRHREGFNRMIADALNGKIDLIVTKSVSRFARNTVDSLTTIRKLKEKGVEVFFQKENIYTLDSKGELLLTIMSSLSQEESRSISENVTWGQRKRMADGKVSLPYSHFLGYRKGKDGIPEIVPEEAEIVRYIYRSFMEGKTPNHIAECLTFKHIPTPAGKEISMIEEKIENIQKQMEQLTKQIRMLIQKQSITPIKSEDHYRQYDGLVISFEKLKSKQDTLIQKQDEMETKLKFIMDYIEFLKSQENLITEFSETLWFRAVDQVIVCTDGKMIFAFKDGSKIKV